MKRIIAIALLALASFTANAGPTWVVIGDSILSSVSGGTSKTNALHLVSTERDVTFRNLASPGAALGQSDYTGFNNTRTIDAMKQIGGAYNFYHGIVIQALTNDFGRSIPWENTVTGLSQIMDYARANGKKVMVLDPIYRDNENTPNGQGDVLNTYRYMAFIVCTQDYGDICHFAHRSNTVLGSQTDYYTPDEVANNRRLHPNVTGHRKLADWIKAEAADAGYF